MQEGALKQINQALCERDFNAARVLLAFGSEKGANRACIRLLEYAIDMCAIDTDFTLELSAVYKDKE